MAKLEQTIKPADAQFIVSFSREELEMLRTVVERDAEQHGNWFLWNMTQGVFSGAGVR